VWSTDEAAYRFLATRCQEGTRTLETGSGLSTALFAALGCEHTCVTPGQQEADRILAYCALKDFPTDRLRFEVAPSHLALPRLADDGDLDLVLVDGGHGYPMPALDWFYAGARLVAGGVVVVDDVHLPAVRSLLQFLDRDPRWPALERTPKWHAYQRTTSGPLTEDWLEQPFYAVPTLRERVVGKARGLMRRP
jgi:predicted O-methyltransferase YrrM